MEQTIERLIEWGKCLDVLYVEDDIALREEVSLFLSDIFARIDLACDGKEGLEKLSKHTYHLVITDIRMPVMDGIEMISRIKELYPTLPILVTSAHNEIEYLEKLINLGVDHFAAKPLQSDNMLQTLYKIVAHIHHNMTFQQSQQALKDAHEKLQRFSAMQSKSLDLKNSMLKAYQEALNKATIVSVTNPMGIIIDVNENFCKATGYTKEEMIGKTHKLIGHPLTDKTLYTQMWETITQKNTWQGLLINQTKNLTPLYHYTTIVPILDAKGDILEFIGIIQDLTQLHELSEEKHNASLERIKEIKENDLINKIPFASATLGEALTFEHYNKLFETLVMNHHEQHSLVKLTQHTLRLSDLISFEEMDYFNTIQDLKDKFSYEGDITFKGAIQTITYTQEVWIKISPQNDTCLICIIQQEDFELCCQVHAR